IIFPPVNRDFYKIFRFVCS
ncbi:hypothetical protein M8J76_009016, partial [Diaphorina citri]